jgi:nitrate/TMAO reductase-like tetraheme cytochrome c subunit
MRFRLPTLKQVAFFGALLFAVTVLFTFASFEVTSSPKFCGSCHNMKPYYESWKGSHHSQVLCVECHIPPGITSELRKKYEALSMVARYFTGTYGTHPWAEVDDANCLACHERRLVEGKVSFGSVTFNHTPHLVEMRRSKKLRCTSCHSQIVQGRHIAVTTSTCFLCHFKNQAPGQGTARCTLCHDIPEKTIVMPGLTFHHSDVRKFDMKCEWCHANVVRGEGDVPQNRCLTCHNEAARLEKYGNTEELHQIHVTEHKVECLHCHNEIQHGIPSKEVHAGQNDCSGCHGEGHSPQQSLYSGMAVKGVLSDPNPMYLAGIRCEGCHMFPGRNKGGEVMQASRISCMACHGAAFERIFDRWQTVTAERLSQTKTLLAQAQQQLASPYPEPFIQARHNIELVENAVPIHNVSYSLSILNNSVELLNQALQQRGKSPLRTPWQIIPFESPCLSCHQGIETQAGAYGDRPFVHFPHVIKQKLDCRTCHVPHEIPVKSLPMKFSPGGCANCHHETRFENLCAKCHEKELAKGVPVMGQVLDRKGKVFEHTMHLEATGLKCTDCHFEKGKFRRTPEAAHCSDCHAP